MILCKVNFCEEFFVPGSDIITRNHVYDMNFASDGWGFSEAIYVGF